MILAKILRSLENKKFGYFVNGTLTLVGFYFIFQKLLPQLSVSQTIGKIFSLDAGIWVKFLLLAWLFICCVVKLYLMYRDAFPLSNMHRPEPEGVNACTLGINEEIKRHLCEVESTATVALQSFDHAHQFDRNVALVTQAMAEHLTASFSGIKVRKRDIFISVYKVPGFEEKDWTVDALEYVTHFDHTRDLVASRVIPLNDSRYSEYECVKTIRSGQPVQIVFDPRNYAASKANRHKTVKHYVGFRLECANKTVGFVNVELHKHQYFSSEEELLEFVERDLYAFRALIEYQFLKKKFFTAVKRVLIQHSSVRAVATP